MQLRGQGLDNRNNDPIVGDVGPAGPLVWLGELLTALTRRRAAPAEIAVATAPQPAGDRLVRRAGWASPVFFAAAFLFAAPFAARFTPPPVNALYAELSAGLPGWTQWVLDRLPGWGFMPWWLAVGAFIARLRAANLAGTSILSAVNWGLVAVTAEAIAWIWVVRPQLAGTTSEVRAGWVLLGAEFAFLMVLLILYGPAVRRRPGD